VPCVFVAGDTRLHSMKRVASAVGEGAMSVRLVQVYLRGFMVEQALSEAAPVLSLRG
jgi:hypothetical protein